MSLRLRLLLALAQREYTLAELTESLDVPPIVAAQELSALCEARLVGRYAPADGSLLTTYALDRTQLDTQCTMALAVFFPGFDEERVPLIEDEDLTIPQPRVLFLCTYNAASSQMAEGILHHLSAGRVAAFSAGSAPTALHPLAIQTLAQAGIDVSDHRPKHLALYRDMRFDYVITLCDCRSEICPTFPGTAEHHLWPVADPSLDAESEEARRAAFARTADDLMGRVCAFLQHLEQHHGGQQ